MGMVGSGSFPLLLGIGVRSPKEEFYTWNIWDIKPHKGNSWAGRFWLPKNSSRLGIDPGIGEFWSQGLHGSRLPGKDWMEGKGEQGCWKGIPDRDFLEKLGINNGLISDDRKEIEQLGGKTQRQKMQLGLDGGLGKFLLSG